MLIEETEYIQTEEGYHIEVEKFVQWLQYMLTELEITHQHFADSIGRSKKTVDRYLSDYETYFPKDARTKREIFSKSIQLIKEHSAYQHYYHIENCLFLRLFRNAVQILNDDRKEKITQEQIAKVINVGQKTICIYLNPNPPYDVKLSTEKQYKLLSFLITQGIKYLYESGQLVDYRKFLDFDYMGYYDCKISERKYISSKLKTKMMCYLLFLLNESDSIEPIFREYITEYIKFSPCLYNLFLKQIESIYRYACTIPTIFDPKFEVWNQRKSERIKDYSFHYQVNYFYCRINRNEFLNIFQTLVIYLKCIVKQQNFQFPTEKNNVYYEILSKHLKALNSFLGAFNKKDRKMKAKEILKAIEKNEFTLKGKLWVNIQNIPPIFIPIEKREVPHHSRIRPSLEHTIEALCSLPMETQEIILENADAFFDFDENFEKNMLYLLMPKRKLEIGDDLEKNVFNRMLLYLEGDFFKTLEDIWGISPYEVIYEHYKEFSEFWGKYINMCGNFQHIHENSTKETSFSPENKERFQQYVSETLCNHVNVLEVIGRKMAFDVYDWYLWGLIQVGIRINPEKTYAIVAQRLNVEDILTLINVH